jgi:hypothetical protein
LSIESKHKKVMGEIGANYITIDNYFGFSSEVLEYELDNIVPNNVSTKASKLGYKSYVAMQHKQYKKAYKLLSKLKKLNSNK